MSRFKVGDNVICVVKRWPYEALNPPSVVGQRYLVAQICASGIPELLAFAGHANFTMEDQYELVTVSTLSSPKSFSPSDIVRLTKDVRRASNTKGFISLFTAGTEWEVASYDLPTDTYRCRLLHTNTETLLAWNEIELLSSAVTQPTLAAPAPHTCQDNIAHYDSGWSRYDYCRVCDKKIVD